LEFEQHLFIPASNTHCQSYKVILFVWECGGLCLPVAFAIWHGGSGKLEGLALQGLSALRNRTCVKALAVLGDAVYGSQEIVKRLSDYGWPDSRKAKTSQANGSVMPFLDATAKQSAP
jgi:hypothetical protein